MKFACSVSLLSKSFAAFILTIVLFSTCFGQAELNPNQITGRIGFSNQNQDIIDFLTNDGDQASLSYIWFFVENREQGLYHHAWQHSNELTPAEMAYELTVESCQTGIQYDLNAQAHLNAPNNERLVYKFATVETGSIFPEPAPDTAIDIKECSALVNIDFVDLEGTPATVYEVRSQAYKEEYNEQYEYSYYQQQAWTYSYSNTETQDSNLLVRADGTSVKLLINYSTGTDSTLDQISFECEQLIFPDCDEVVSVTCVIPEGGELGAISGTFDILGVEERLHQYGGGVKAWWGPFDNKREFAFSENPASGPFNLPNLVPSEVADYPRPYYVWAETVFGKGYRTQYFRTAYTSSTWERPTLVAAGETLDLGQLMEMQPAEVMGEVVLAGPPPGEGVNCLESMYRDADSDYDNDGNPDQFYIYHSGVNARGHWEVAPGASYNSSGAEARVGFEGALNTETGVFTGDYSLLLANYNNDSTYWQPERLALAFQNREYYDPAIFQMSKMEVHPRDIYSKKNLIVPGQTYIRSQKYCLSKVTITHKTSSGTFYNPMIRGKGFFIGTDFTRTHAEYETDIQYAYGTPFLSGEHSQNGQVVLCLPQGEYELEPRVLAVGSNNAHTNVELRPITVTVGCGQEMEVSTDLQMALTQAPTVTESPVEILKGLTFSDGNVTSVSYIQNDGQEVSICSDCGKNASFEVEVLLAQGTNTFEFIAYDEFDNRAFVKTNLEYQPAPIELYGCSDRYHHIEDDSDSAAVEFKVLAKKGCDAEPSIRCSKRSGDEFELGITQVSCTAQDSCGTEDACSFNVHVSNTPGEDDSGCSEYETRPEITFETTKYELWPPNHKFVPVGVPATAVNTCNGLISDDTGEDLPVKISVWSNETEVPQAGDGSGNTAPDARNLNKNLQLRAERRGTGNGRVYLLVAKAQNSDGNISTGCSAVVVSHSKKAKARAAVYAEAAAAVNYCEATGSALPGYTQHGVSQLIGNQKVIAAQALNKNGKKKKGKKKKGKKKKGKKKGKKKKGRKKN